MSAMFMAAFGGTIIATAMPSIVADLIGRKPVFMFGVIFLLVGSILCETAYTLQGFFLFCFIHGIGAGVVQPIMTTVIGDIFSLIRLF